MQAKRWVFISYINEAKELAEALKEQISDVFSDEDFHFFIAAQRESIKPSEAFHKKIEDALAKSEAYIILCSDTSIRAPWVNFETGAARMSRMLGQQSEAKNPPKVFLLAYGGLKPGAIKEGPFSGMQLMDIGEEKDILFMLQGLGELINREPPKIFKAKEFIGSLPAISKGPDFHEIILPALKEVSHRGKNKLTGPEIREIVKKIVRCASLAKFGKPEPDYVDLPIGVDTSKAFQCDLCGEPTEMSEFGSCRYCGLLCTVWMSPVDSSGPTNR